MTADGGGDGMPAATRCAPPPARPGGKEWKAASLVLVLGPAAPCVPANRVSVERDVAKWSHPLAVPPALLLWARTLGASW